MDQALLARCPHHGGTVVGVLGRHFGLWWLNACRIVYVIEEEEASLLKRYGFGFGTLPGHVERGEERFTVEWHRAEDSVLYEVFAFARPAPWPTGGSAIRAAAPETVRGCLPAGHGCGPSQHFPVPKRVPHPL